ncbi:DUF4062 domain-containing protein [Nocardia sp. NPDC004068]|uniref:DUF4062 domain-containing protein n=1 Tax=Nocardia sp. NPDC004068 TaxID=3364303 RepID=UPI0036AFA0AC
MAIIPVFVSSTFRDFHFERDALIASVLPELNDLVAGYGCRVEMIDLRWGVSAGDDDEATQQARVLEVCLSEIERARPLFVGLLGERYGWVPDELRLALALFEADIADCPPGISVTALEFEYGALRAPASRAVFFEREWVGSAPRAWRDEVLGPVLELKSRVRDRCPVHSYRVIPEGPRPKDMADFVACVSRVLGAEVVHRAQELAGRRIDPITAAEALFFEDRLHGFDGREQVLTDILAQLRSGTGVCLTGMSGIGKSSLWCAAVRRLEAEGHVVVAVPAGASPEISTARAVLIRACSALGVADGLTALDDEALENAFRSALSASSPLVLAIDGLDQLLSDAKPGFLAGLPEHATVLVSTTSSAQARYAAAQGIVEIAVPALPAADGRRAVDAICGALRRRLPAPAVESLTMRPRIPLWLRLAIAELSALSADDFGGVDPSANPVSAIADLVTATVRDLPDETGALVSRIVDRAAVGFGVRLVTDFLAFAAVSRSGLRPNDLERLLGVETLTIAAIRRSLSGLLIARGEGGRLGFAHAVVRDHIEQRNIGIEDRPRLHRAIAEHLARYPDDPLCESDRLWHIFRSDGLSAAPILNAVPEHRRAELSTVVAESADAGDLRAAFEGVDVRGLDFVSGSVHRHKFAMRAESRIALCLRLLATARELFEYGRVDDRLLGALANATGCLADLPESRMAAADLARSATDALAFGRLVVDRYPESLRAHEVLAHLSMWFARESADETAALEARKVSVREWDMVAERDSSPHVPTWLQFALVEYAGSELKAGHSRAARAAYERALPLAREMFAANPSFDCAVNVMNVLVGLGNVADHEKNGAEMLSHFAAAVDLAEWGYSVDAGRSAIRQVAITARCHGMALLDQERTAEARRWLERSTEMWQLLAAIDPDDTQWPFGADTAGRLCAVLVVLGDPDEVPRIVRDTLARTPEPGSVLGILAQALIDCARTSMRRRDFVVAEAICAATVAMFDAGTVAPSDWSRVCWARALEMLAECRLRRDARGDAATSLRAAIARRQEAADTSGYPDPRDAREVGVSLLRLSEIDDRSRHVLLAGEVARHWSRWLAEDLGSAGPQNEWMIHRLVDLAASSPADADALLAAAGRYVKPLMDSEPDNEAYLFAFVRVIDILGVTRANLGRMDDAARLWCMAAETVAGRNAYPPLAAASRNIADNLFRVSRESALDPALARGSVAWARRLTDSQG